MDEQPVAIVTGAGSGIGRAAALRLAAAGYAVVLAARGRASLEAVAEQIGGGADTLIVPTDVAEPDDVRRLVERTVECFGRVDAVVNNAGFAALSTIAQTTPQRWRSTVDVNLSGPVLLTAAAWEHLAKRGGVVVNVSSMATRDPFPGLWTYATAKAGLEMFTRCIATEGAEANIRAAAILPGAVETPMLRSAFDEQALPKDKTLDPDAVAAVIADCVTGRRPFEPGEQILVPSPN